MENSFLSFKWILNKTSTVVFLFILSIGFRDYLPFTDVPRAPNFMEFNMYVYDIESLKTGGEHPDIYLLDEQGGREYIEFSAINNLIHSGFLFQGDRWKPYPKLVKDFFCKNTTLLNGRRGSIKVTVEYLKNKKEVIRENYDFQCD